MNVIRLGLLFTTTLISAACAKPELRIDDQHTVINAERAILLTPDVRTRLFKQLKLNRDIWEQSKLKSYQYRWHESCFCPSAAYYGPNDIYVESGKVTKVIYQGDIKEDYNIEENLIKGDVVTTAVADSHEIDYLFKIIEDILQKTPSNYNSSWGAGVIINPYGDETPADIQEMLTVQYDKTYKYPTLVSFDAIGVFDDEYTIRIKNFKKQ